MASIPPAPSAEPGRGQLAVPALVAGTLLALAVPPWGYWPLAILGLALLYRLIEPLTARHRFLAGLTAGFVLYAASLWWMTDFHPAAIGVPLIEALFFGLALAMTLPGAGRGRPFVFAAAILLADAARSAFPVRGLPLGGLDLGLVSSPLAMSARIGGRLLLPALAALVAAALVEAILRRWAITAVATSAAVAVVGAGFVAPHGHDLKTVDIAIVQGGGRRGYRAVDSNPLLVYEAHLDTTDALSTPVDLLLWPEDVVDVDGPIATTAQGAELSALARDRDTTLVAGIVEGDGPFHFRNAAVAWGPDGTIVDRFEKVRRVPFGEYVPGRSWISRFADLSVIPRDAIEGSGSGLLRTPVGPLATAISYEVFFPDRARAGVREGGQLVLIPTNAASFATSQVPTQQLGAARLRAIETGRWLLQAGPTGYSAVIDPSGNLVKRSDLGRRQILTARVSLRSGLTPYTRIGDWPWVFASVAGLMVVRFRRTRLR